MLDALFSFATASPSQDNHATLKMARHERMAGSVPVWEKTHSVKSAKEETAQKFADALNDKGQDTAPSPLRMALRDQNTPAPVDSDNKGDSPFGFGDLIDMINPLHHIPIISTLYRNITGDSIRDPGKVIGGALFGGPLGAASSMVNMIVEHDTGHDLTGHAMNILRSETKTAHPPPSPNPQTLAQAILAYESQAPESNTENTYIRTMRL